MPVARTTVLAVLVAFLPVAHPPQAAEGAYDLARMEAFSWVLLQIKQEYVDPTRIDPPKMLDHIFEAIERRMPEVEIDSREGITRIQVANKQREFKIGKPGTVWELNYNLQPVLQFIGENLEQGSDPKDVEFAAINGMLSTLDPHSNMLPPELFREMQLKTTGEFGGLGIRITLRKGALTVMSPLPDSPAARLGLKAMDQIVRIGDQSTVNMPLDEAVNMLRGPPGSKVAIWIKRVGWSEPHKYVIQRETIRVRSITAKLLDDKVGYIRIQDFTRHTGGDLLRHLSDLKREARGLRGLVLDLRDNAGGLMKAAVQVADLFLDHGIIVATVSYDADSTPDQRIQKSREEQRAKADGEDADLPIVVLVNAGSASASEILAGALKNLDRAVLMGEQTFGKGTVQILNDRVPSSVEGACLKLTVAEYLIPGDVSIQEIGVTPDVRLVPMLLDKDDLQIFAQPERFREEDIPTHLKKQQTARLLKPAHEIRYVYDSPRPKEPPPGTEEEPPAEPQEDEVREDFEIRLARDFLLRSKTANASSMLDSAVPLLKEVEQREQSKLTAALRGFNIDWSDGASEGARRAKVDFKLLNGTGQPPLAAADTQVTLKLEVTNTGAAPFHRLRAVARSPIDLFDRREFLFGKVDPGQTRTWEVPVRVPRSVSTRTDELRFEFFCDGGAPPPKVSTTIGTQGLDRPAFGFSWRLLDTKGNGDGLLQPGERAELEVTVYNQGRGRAVDARALLKNEAGRDLFLESDGGRVQFKEIEAGGSRTQSFRFHVHESTTATELPVELTIWDGALQVTQVSELKLPVVAQAPKPTTVDQGLKVRLAQAPIRGGANVATPQIASAKKGDLLVADRKAGDWFRLSGKQSPLGWINADAVQPVPSAKAKAALAVSLAPFVQNTPPRIDLTDLPAYIESGDKITLRGVVTDEDQDIRDVAVWIGGKKLLLKPGDTRERHRLPFQLDVPLEAGPNLVTVIAREGTRFSSSRALVVTRPGGLDKKRSDEEELAFE